MNKSERIKMVKAMEFIARHVETEEAFAPWLVEGVADEDIEYGDLDDFDNGELDYYLEDNNLCELMDTFLYVMKKARKDGGLSCDGARPTKEEE